MGRFFMAKYSRLTKEQFEELHEEFINFLATQSITGKEWDETYQGKSTSELIWNFMSRYDLNGLR